MRVLGGVGGGLEGHAVHVAGFFAFLLLCQPRLSLFGLLEEFVGAAGACRLAGLGDDGPEGAGIDVYGPPTTSTTGKRPAPTSTTGTAAGPTAVPCGGRGCPLTHDCLTVLADIWVVRRRQHPRQKRDLGLSVHVGLRLPLKEAVERATDDRRGIVLLLLLLVV